MSTRWSVLSAASGKAVQCIIEDSVLPAAIKNSLEIVAILVHPRRRTVPAQRKWTMSEQRVKADIKKQIKVHSVTVAEWFPFTLR